MVLRASAFFFIFIPLSLSLSLPLSLSLEMRKMRGGVARRRRRAERRGREQIDTVTRFMKQRFRFGSLRLGEQYTVEVAQKGARNGTLLLRALLLDF